MSEEVIESTAPQETEIQESHQEPEIQVQKHDTTTQNWELARQALAQQKAEIEELRAQLVPKKPDPEVDEFDGLDPDDYLTVKEFKTRFEKTAEKKAMQAATHMLEQYKLQHEIAADEQRQRGKHEDYDFVVENYAVPMIKNNPALAIQVQSSKNPAETAYMLGKLSDQYRDAMNKQPGSNKAEKIIKNSQRPVSSASVVNGSLKSQADNFATRSKSDIWQEAQKYAKQA